MIQRKLYLNRIIPYIDTEVIKVITGVRRSGKSIMLDLIRNYLLNSGITDKQIIKMNFEEIKYEKYLDYSELNKFLEKLIEESNNKVYIFLDEIQEVNQFEKLVNSLRASYSDRVDIYITGSNANLLSGELSSLLSGRYVQFDIFPFKFSEYVEAKRSIGRDDSVRDLFNSYILEGGLPFLAMNNFNLEDASIYLKDIYNSIILKDIISRESVRDPELLQRLMRFILANIFRPFSANSISKYLKNESVNISVPTVLNYLDFAEKAYALFSIDSYDIQGKQYLNTRTKYYVVDHGLKQSIIGRNEDDIELILENIVLMELKARGYNVYVGKTNKYEVDFVAEKIVNQEKEIIYIQVSYLLASKEIRDREFRSLEEISDNYEKIVISMDPIVTDRNGIKHSNIIDWLMN